MTNNNKTITINNAPALLAPSKNIFIPTIFRSRTHHCLAATIFAGFVYFMFFTSAISSAAPPAHANGHAQNNITGKALPDNVHSKHGNSKEWARGRILVMPRAGLPAKALANILKEHDGKARKIGQSDLYVVDLPEYTEEGVIARLAHHPHLKFVELDYLESPTYIPNDTYYPNAWHLPKIGAPLAWDNTLGAGITIASLDSGVNSAHPDLAAQLVPGWNFYDNNSNTSDVYGHGTIVAGAAAAASDNSTGVTSVAGQAKIMPIRVAAPNGSGYTSMIANGLIYAADRGVRVASISFANMPSRSTVVNAAQYMRNKNGLVFVSAGNSGIDENFNPTTALIPVSATDGNDAKTSWSSYGNYVAVSAPGLSIWTTNNNGGYSASSGTSLSSPVAAGVAALMMAANPGMRNTDIENTLFSTAVDLGAAGRDPYYGYGRVDAAAAVQAVVSDIPELDNEAPVVAILDPLGGATISDLVPVDIEAFDNVDVTRVELWVNNTSVAVDTTAPFAFTWDSNGVANGPANLIARAFDAAGNAASSDTVQVTVDNPDTAKETNAGSPTQTAAIDTKPPVVQIVNPSAGNVSGNITITVNASDNSGATGINLFIYVDGNLEATGTGSTLSTNWNTHPKRIEAGTHTIKAVATDAAGNSASAFVNVIKQSHKR
ncbi:Subtilase family protein [Nitrosomonas aestuarii]|uniref:Subtilase family protein n=1 Tax=Nitrosomonas aestuarii TaxID=52441 RepID=A0A1I3ZHN0_9PROT|nr:S8 family serine peptidase [Nitrosomonas aestuarii]SFK43587.1 Subtilase family protein [Nitrosomonas aestuarii]